MLTVRCGAGGCGEIRRPCLQRLYRHFAKLDHAGAVLQSEWSFDKQTIVQLDRLLAVQHDRNLPALRGDLIRVPFAAGLRHRIDFGEVNDAAGTVGRVLRWSKMLAS